MSSTPRSAKTMTVKLTRDEAHMLQHALTIATEDGSLYPTKMDDDEQAASDKDLNAAVDALRKKLIFG